MEAQESLSSPITKDNIADWLQKDILRRTEYLFNIEQEEGDVAYMQLFQLLACSVDVNSLIQESSQLHDKVFYVADSLESDNKGNLTVTVWPNGFVRLNDKIPVNGLPTINELRKSEKPGILFSGVAAVSIETRNGKYIPLLKRDAGAPSDAGKFTLPAGRADTSPWLTAYKELVEELVIFWKTGDIDTPLVQIVPFLKNGGTSEEKAKQLALIGRSRYIQSILKSGSSNILLTQVQSLISAPVILEELTVLDGGVNVTTIFPGKEDTPVIEGGFVPVMDKWVNTMEFVRIFWLDLSKYEDINVGDGDGFGRETALFSPDDVRSLGTGNMVVSLAGVMEQLTSL